MTDQTSLDLLNDIVLSATVGWWPLAPGWYVVAIALLMVLLVFSWRSLKKWQSNQYRRIALQELASISSSDTPELGRLPELLKRVALCVWPRTQVASLSGKDWHEFLDQSVGDRSFCAGPGNTLDRLSYDAEAGQKLSKDDSANLLKASENWLRHHQKQLVES
jgi:hypothetical protein